MEQLGDLVAAGIKGIITDESLFPLVPAHRLGMTIFTLTYTPPESCA